MNMRFWLPPLIVLLAFSAGCTRTTSDVLKPGGDIATVQEGFTAQDVRAAIIKGCVAKNWSPVEIDSFTIEAAITVSAKYIVVVSIPYNATAYAINYKSSVNMNYRANKDGTFSIHPRYNNWVGDLDQAIRARIAEKRLSPGL